MGKVKINYQETISDLAKRIDIHQKYGSKNIDQWMLEILKPKEGIDILDIGCGSGKQCFLFYDYLRGDGQITGGDFSLELLDQAKEENKKRKTDINFFRIDFNQPLPFVDDSFDLVTCCFAIYYAKDIVFTVKEIFRVLKPKGKFFTSGPMPQNKKVFYEIISEATKKPIPPMPGSSRYNSEILSAFQKQFGKIEVEIFENPLIFPETTPFMEYTRASLSEDRKIWADFFKEESFESVMGKIQKAAESYIKKNDQIIMTKVVGGFIAEKRSNYQLI